MGLLWRDCLAGDCLLLEGDLAGLGFQVMEQFRVGNERGWVEIHSGASGVGEREISFQ